MGNFLVLPKKTFMGICWCLLKKRGKMITPGAAELQKNKRSRSAKLRIGEKL